MWDHQECSTGCPTQALWVCLGHCRITCENSWFSFNNYSRFLVSMKSLYIYNIIIVCLLRVGIDSIYLKDQYVIDYDEINPIKTLG